MSFAGESALSKDLLLLGIDLEDVRTFVAGGERYVERVPLMIARFLNLFDRYEMRTTFFVVGDVARRYPDLVKALHDAGHEIACHTDAHEPLERMDREALRKDLSACLDVFAKLNVGRVQGFRAPTLSLTSRTQWAYEVLRELGFTYSSSVLPGRNPLYSWSDFGTEPRLMSGVWELPVTVLPLGPLRLPFASGVYLRALPKPFIGAAARYIRRRGSPVVGYLHPYDIDDEQERFRHPFTENSNFYHWLMFYNRKSALGKIDALLASGMRLGRYDEFVARLSNDMAHAA